MRALLVLLFSAMIGVSSAGADERLKVVTTFTVLADMARNVAGEHIDVVSITKPGAEIHDYQPTPGDIVKAQDADLILYNGFNLERWFQKFLIDLDGVQAVILTENVTPLSIYNGPYDGKPNPHAWMSVSNALIYVENIQKAFSALDPNNADAYAENARIYKEEIRALGDEIRNELAKIEPSRRWLVTSEGAFSYLAEDMGMKELFLWPINAERQGTPGQMNAVIARIREHNIPVIFSESTISNKPAKQVAQETGIYYGGILYVDSLSQSDGPVPTYLDLLSVTTRTIVQGFQDAQKLN